MARTLHYQTDSDIVIAATRWLLARYRVVPAQALATQIRAHLDWLAARPELAAPCAALGAAWRHTTRGGSASC